MLSNDLFLEARRRIQDHILQTPLTVSASLSAIAGAPVYLKLEHRQLTGSFKLRGAANAILSLDQAQKQAGVTAVSTGNHGRAVAYAAKAVGSQATICLSSLVPNNKVAAIEQLGARVRIIGQSQDEAQIEAERLVAEEGLVMVPPFDSQDVIVGQATLGLEIVEALPDLRHVFVPLSGGGLAAGVAAAIKAKHPRTRIIGVSMERGAAMQASLAAGHPVLVQELPTLADSLGGGVGLENAFSFAMCRDLLDDVILLSEAEIAAGLVHAYHEEREIVEGAGAVGIAAVLARKTGRLEGPTVLLMTGRNIDMNLHRRVINGENPFERTM